MKKITIFATLLLLVNQSVMAADTSADMQASAEVTASCFLEVDDLNFGDVSQQTYQGSGDVTASTNLRILCTKNAATQLSTNFGLNGSAGETGITVDRTGASGSVGSQLNNEGYLLETRYECNDVNGCINSFGLTPQQASGEWLLYSSPGDAGHQSNLEFTFYRVPEHSVDNVVTSNPGVFGGGDRLVLQLIEMNGMRRSGK